VRNVQILAIVFSFGVLTVFGQELTVDQAGANLKKILKKSSRLITQVSIDTCRADIRLLTSEMDFRANHASTPPQGMAGFPTGDYGSNNFSSDSALIYRSMSYSIDLSRVGVETLNTSEFSSRGPKYANVGFPGESISLKTGKRTENVNQFRVGILPKAITKVEAAFRDLISACSASK